MRLRHAHPRGRCLEGIAINSIAMPSGFLILRMSLSENRLPLFRDMRYFGVLMSSGRKRVSIIFARSISPLIAPTMLCTSTIRFMPSRWIWPEPQ